MKLMQYDRIPRKYHLLWNENQKVIVIQIYKDCLHRSKPVKSNSPLVEMVSQDHCINGIFDSFSGDLRSDSFGFNDAMKKVGECDQYVEFIVPLPQIRTYSNFSCEDCAGTGKSTESFRFGEKCMYCGGSGKKSIYDWRSGYIVTSSLSLLFNIMFMDELEETSAKDFQHVVVSMLAQHGLHGSSISGCFGIDFSEFIRSDSFELHPSISKSSIQAMRTAYGQMAILENDLDRRDIRVEIDKESISLTCPGNACGIDASFYDKGPNVGSEFDCHNVDSPLQSLTILSGIASLVGQVGRLISEK